VAQAMQEELDRVLKKGFCEQEVAETREATLRRLKVPVDGDVQIAVQLLQSLSTGRALTYFGDLEKKFAGLTAAEENSAFRKHIDPTRLVIVQAGDFKKKP
jgi:zinc protease